MGNCFHFSCDNYIFVKLFFVKLLMPQNIFSIYQHSLLLLYNLKQNACPMAGGVVSENLNGCIHDEAQSV